MTETQLRLNAVKERALNEQPQILEDLLAAADAPLADLIEAAHEVTAAKASSVFNFCAIVNAKSGSLVCAVQTLSRRLQRLSPS